MKKVLLIFIALLMMFGCSSNSGGGQDSGNQNDPEVQTIKIGGSGPLSGGAAVYGNAVKNGASIAVKEINEKGGLQFELLFEDDEHDTEKAVSAFNALIDKGMQVSISCVTSGPAATVSPLYAENHIFALTPSASSTSVTLANVNDASSYYGNVFQMCYTDPNLGVGSADYISQHSLGSKIAIIYKNDDPYSVGVYEKFIAQAEKVGLDIVYTATFDDSSAQDFNVQLSQSRDAQADLVFLPMYYDPASLILTQANTMDYHPVFFGVDGMDGILALEGFDVSLAEGVYLLTPFSADSSDAITANFVKKYQEEFGEVPNQFAADAYDCIYAIAQACEKGGVSPEMSASEICDIMIAQFTSMSFNGTTGGSTWSANGEVTKLPMAVIIKDGVYVGAQ